MFRKSKEVLLVELTIPEGYTFKYTVKEINGYKVNLGWSLTYQDKQVDFGTYRINSNEENLEDKMWYFGYRKADRANRTRIIEEAANLSVGAEITLPATRVLEESPVSNWYWRHDGMYESL